MSTHPVTVTPEATFKRMASLMRAHRISGLPVVDEDGHPVGVVSETDLLAKERRPSQPMLTWLHPERTLDHLRAQGSTAREVMTAPAETVPLHTTVVVAARRLHDTGVRRLLVVDESGRLVGLVTRNDLLRAFLRRDEEIRRDAEAILQRWPSTGAGGVGVSVDEGIVTLRGRMPTTGDIDAVVELIGLVDGVIETIADDVVAGHGDPA